MNREISQHLLETGIHLGDKSIAHSAEAPNICGEKNTENGERRTENGERKTEKRRKEKVYARKYLFDGSLRLESLKVNKGYGW